MLILPLHEVHFFPYSNDKEVEIIEADCGTTRLEAMKVKLLQFCENYRPAYYGTWGKKSAYICPRNPLKKDEVCGSFYYVSAPPPPPIMSKVLLNLFSELVHCSIIKKRIVLCD